MPISVIGNKRPRHDAGFSLVEAMAALMIIALVVAGVLLAAPGADSAAKGEAQRLAARVLAASEESILVNRPLALVVTSEGYSFERLEANGWVAAGHAAPFGFYAWPDDLNVVVAQRSGEADDPRVARFDALGGATPALIVLGNDGASWRVGIEGDGGAYVARAE